VELLGETPNGLSASAACQKFQHCVNRKLQDSVLQFYKASSYNAAHSDKLRFKFQKRSQLVIRPHVSAAITRSN
jgi:hypothetical protein